MGAQADLTRLLEALEADPHPKVLAETLRGYFETAEERAGSRHGRAGSGGGCTRSISVIP